MPITIPQGSTAELKDKIVTIRGSKGELSQTLTSNVSVKIDDQQIVVTRNSDEKKARSEHGLTRSLINNMLIGVNEGFKKQLAVNGVGFKSSVSGQTLKLSIGLSHDVTFTAPEGIQLKAEENVITVEGIDKQLVGQTAAEIRKLKKPEPYKGKGIMYVDEYVIRKSGKAAAGSAE
jgi:large subunit ribosomal protein L6